MNHRKRKSSRLPDRAGGTRRPVGLRIVGGRFRGRKLDYTGDWQVRPMKERLREAIFNRLGPAVKGQHAVDLFAGTGAMAIEALSRGAARATFVEQHFPTAKVVRQNVAALGLEVEAEVVTANTFIWWKKRPQLSAVPWLVFCCPPYDFYIERQEAMLELIGGILSEAPPGSLLVVESDTRFDPALLPEADAWDVRRYPPAVVAIHSNPSA